MARIMLLTIVLAVFALTGSALESKRPIIGADGKATSPTVATSNWTPPAALPTIYKHFDCGTTSDNASDHFLATVKSLHQKDLALFGGSSGPALAVLAARAASPIRIDMYIHVISSTANAGTISPVMVAAQAAAMNAAYNPYGIFYKLRDVTYTTNDAWASIAQSSDEMAMKAALRNGSYSALNLYFHTDLAGGVLGKCTLPTQIGSNTPAAAYVVDGCNLAAQTMPGGVIYGYNLGKTAVHETGHWLGLLHTFEGYSCSGAGDFVSDTPQESMSTDGCPMVPWKNSCKGSRAGVDPIRNYMDYSTDACYIRFTQGQMGRVRNLWAMYRQGK